MSIPKVVSHTIISVVVILVLLVGAGFAYTYFLGPDGSQGSKATPAPPPTQTLPKPTQAAENAPVSASVQSLLSPVAPGANTSLTVRTKAGSTCKIIVLYGTAASKDSGLASKIADDYGTVSWTWTVEASVPPGKYPIDVTCVRGEKSARVVSDLLVEKPAAKPATP